MKNNNYKILVLSDLKKPAETSLKSTVSLAQMIGGTIHFFHVKNPTEVVSSDNQLSAIRSINEEHFKIRNKIQTLIAPISEEFDIPIKFNFTMGNVKNEIEKYINETKPDIIVLGKRKPNIFKFIGDSITQFMLTQFEGVIFIVADKNAIEPNKKVTIGLFDTGERSLNLEFADDLMANTEVPLKSFKILKKKSSHEKTTSSTRTTVEYIFEQGDNAVKNLSKYLSINKINLLCIDRKNGESLADSNINEAMNRLNVSLLLGKEKLQINSL